MKSPKTKFFGGSEDVELKFLRAKEQNAIYIFNYTMEINFDTAKFVWKIWSKRGKKSATTTISAC